jgi:hypothetical protein
MSSGVGGVGGNDADGPGAGAAIRQSETRLCNGGVGFPPHDNTMHSLPQSESRL